MDLGQLKYLPRANEVILSAMQLIVCAAEGIDRMTGKGAAEKHPNIKRWSNASSAY